MINQVAENYQRQQFITRLNTFIRFKIVLEACVIMLLLARHYILSDTYPGFLDVGAVAVDLIFTLAVPKSARRRNPGLYFIPSLILSTLAVTLVIYSSGGFVTPFTGLYLLLIFLSAAITGQRRITYLETFFCLLGYTVIAVLEGYLNFFPAADWALFYKPLSADTAYMFYGSFVIIMVGTALVGSDISHRLLESNKTLYIARMDIGREIHNLEEKREREAQVQQKLLEASENLLTAAQAQLSTSAKQSQTMNEISATIAELNQTADHIAIIGGKVANEANETLETVHIGQDTVSSSVLNMGFVRERAEVLVQRILELSTRAQEIRSVVNLIDNIAGGTHLLALNASIEAAGAGETGQRFSIVASEVKKLSRRTAGEAAYVQQLISDLLAAMNSTVMATEQSLKEVTHGVELTVSVQHSIGGVIDAAQRTALYAKEIAQATEQQRQASEYVVQAIQKMSKTLGEVQMRNELVSRAATTLLDSGMILREIIKSNEIEQQTRQVAVGALAPE